MEREVSAMRRIAEEEGDRLRRWSRRVAREWQKLSKRYPSARRLASDVDFLQQTTSRFLSALDRMDWVEALDGLRKEIDRVIDRSEPTDSSRWQWDRERGVFRPTTDGPAWRDGSEWTVDVARWVECPLEVDETSAVSNGAVSYPILCTHRVRANHQAVARALGWAAVMTGLRRCLQGRAKDLEVLLCHEARQDVVTGETDGWERGRPGADEFGFVAHGELLRRMERFDEVDAEAHWIRWRLERRVARRELRVMGERGGSRLRIEVERPLRRMRLVERRASRVVRKRRHVFVEPRRARTEDRYFADVDELDAALEEEMAAQIEAGFRILSEEYFE